MTVSFNDLVQILVELTVTASTNLTQPEISLFKKNLFQ